MSLAGAFIPEEGLQLVEVQWHQADSQPPYVAARVDHLSLAGQPLPLVILRQIVGLLVLDYLRSMGVLSSSRVPSRVSSWVTVLGECISPVRQGFFMASDAGLVAERGQTWLLHKLLVLVPALDVNDLVIYGLLLDRGLLTVD